MMNQYPQEVIEKIRQLRSQKLSLGEISNQLNIPKPSVATLCYQSGIDNHEGLRINNEVKRVSIKNSDLADVPEIKNITPENARFLASILYGCEGSKYPSTRLVSFVNSDPNLIKLFATLLRKGFTLDESKFRVHLQIHTTHNYKGLKNFWSNLINIPTDQFYKPTITNPRNKMRRSNYSGTCSLRYSDNNVQLRLIGSYEKFTSI
jgi:hypothetical protein